MTGRELMYCRSSNTSGMVIVNEDTFPRNNWLLIPEIHCDYIHQLLGYSQGYRQLNLGLHDMAILYFSFFLFNLPLPPPILPFPHIHEPDKRSNKPNRCLSIPTSIQ